MKEEHKEGVSAGERLALAAAALVPGALGSISLLAGSAGALAWLAPVIALPVGLVLCRGWGRLGEKGLPLGLEEAFGRGLGKCLEALYLLWALFLTVERADGYARRLMTTTEGESVRWLYLGVGLALCLWLARRGTVLARTGKLFFLAVAAVLALSLLLALPGADWKNLWPPRPEDLTGLPVAAVTALGLSGYGVFALCLPGRGERGARPGAWTVWSCAVFSALILAVVGAFGPALAARMKEPFLLLLQGVEVPGAFRRGEAALTAALALADWALLALLTWGCRRLWGSLTGLARGGGALTAGAFLLAGLLPRWPLLQDGMTQMAVFGNLIFGVGLPGLGFLLKKGGGDKWGKARFSGESNARG